ncbi:hypothetical protein CYY_000623 [Polysphondylium violaceum]|uniref:Superoxide dismutase copper/zinc binding domain-containing protein n=1 Tax=Polysphondylium violaceum TaxID=133409 RepID=A0A8J4Q4E1_9MYCE|nr:hypothetical protein CYY_000623 [Polysphondylium violaceum]
MKYTYFLLLCILSVAAVKADYYYASCVFLAGGQVEGSIQFTQNDEGLHVYTNVTGSGLKSGSNHTILIYQYGDMPSGFGGVLTGPPAKLNDACTDAAGDLGNWTVSGTNINQFKTFNKGFWTPSLNNTDYNIIGRGIQIWELGMDCDNQANLGKLLGQCVIGISNATLVSVNSPIKQYVSVGGNNLAQSNTPTQYAVCEFKSSYPATSAVANIQGRVVFRQNAKGELVYVVGSFDIPSSPKVAHGLHIHTLGDLTNGGNNGKPDGSSVGGHWKNSNQVHALPSDSNNQTRDLGDLGNLCYNPQANQFYYSYNVNNFDITSAWGTQNIIGRAMALHATADLGNANVGGSRVALCVIGLMSQQGTVPTSPQSNTAPGTCTVEASSEASSESQGTTTTATGGSTTTTATGGSTTTSTGGSTSTGTGDSTTTTGGNSAALNSPSLFVAFIIAALKFKSKSINTIDIKCCIEQGCQKNKQHWLKIRQVAYDTITSAANDKELLISSFILFGLCFFTSRALYHQLIQVVRDWEASA